MARAAPPVQCRADLVTRGRECRATPVTHLVRMEPLRRSRDCNGVRGTTAGTNGARAAPGEDGSARSGVAPEEDAPLGRFGARRRKSRAAFREEATTAESEAGVVRDNNDAGWAVWAGWRPI
jgi:hypothetical protein